ncbi:lipase family protein [Pendulispora rubella]|uniref:Lipase family protein n=1 Tax=Pendulispora rubella TaxID=2741070 RepID=A0ABZ2KTC6_9BACT
MKNPILQSNPLGSVAQGVKGIAQDVRGASAQVVAQMLSPLTRFQHAFFESCLAPDGLPPGSQDPFAETAETVRKPPPGTNPVVLIHGTWANRYNTWKTLSPELQNAGFALFAINYGDTGTFPKVIKGYADIRESAKELALFVDEVLKKTGAKKVDLVGHSQGGGLMPRWYLKFLGGSEKVDKLIGIAPSNHGCTGRGIGTLCHAIITLLGVQGYATEGISLMSGQAGLQQSFEGSQNLNLELDRDGDTEAGVNYTVLASLHDEVVTPWKNAYLNPRTGHQAVNYCLQEYKGYKFDLTAHLGSPNHPVTAEIVKRALLGKPCDTTSVVVPNVPPLITP